MRAIAVLILWGAGMAVPGGMAAQPQLQYDADIDLGSDLVGTDASVEGPWWFGGADGDEQVKVLMGMPRRSFLGLGVSEIDAERAKALKLREERGVEVTRVEEESPAEKAGLKKGDVVLQYNGERVEGTEQFVRMVRETPPGRQAKLTISRDGQTQTLTATIGHAKGRAMHAAPKMDFDKFKKDLEEMKELRIMPEMSWEYGSSKGGKLGVVAEPLEDQLAEYFGVKEGVLIRSVMKESPAEKAGIKAGDVILKIDEQKVTSVRGLSEAVRTARAKKTFPVTVSRKGKEMTLPVTMEDQERSWGDVRKEQRVIRKTDLK